MKHLGDITKINWFEVEPVDVVTGGSPCQDLSVAGKRAGLAGERSGLFMEQIRCVKELRQADVQRGRTGEFIRPRYMVWENVPGAFSSGTPKGADFAAVIEEIIKVAEPNADLHVRVPDRGWPKSGCYYAEDGSWSIAYRVHDAQYWGVPQRRKRIALLADFGGLSAADILFDPKLRREAGGGDQDETFGNSGETHGQEVRFESKSMSGDFEQSGTERKEAAGAAVQSFGCEDAIGIDHVMISGGTTYQGRGWYENVSGCLKTQPHGVCAGFSAGQGAKAAGIGWQEECSPSLKAAASGTNMTPAVYDARGNGNGEIVCTITGDYQNRVTDYSGLCVGNGPSVMVQQSFGLYKESEVGSACKQRDHKDATDLVVSVDCRNGYENDELSGTIQAKENGGQSLNYINHVRCANTVRRLTTLECERLQGYPDGWTNIGEWVDSKGKKHKEADSPRYKALGNSIALPFWKWLLKRISAQYERDATLGSLFDGIGGFPYCWERVNGKGTARWASEIEEFPVAVTKLRFGEE